MQNKVANGYIFPMSEVISTSLIAFSYSLRFFDTVQIKLFLPVSLKPILNSTTNCFIKPLVMSHLFALDIFHRGLCMMFRKLHLIQKTAFEQRPHLHKFAQVGSWY